MFKINNESFFEIWDGCTQSYIFKGNEKELIAKIAGYWRKCYSCPEENIFSDFKFINDFIEQCACSPKDPGGRRYQIFDNYNRIIQPLDYKDSSFLYWQSLSYPKGHKRWSKWDNVHYIFRQGPVPHTRKWWRGGSRQRMQKTKHIFLAHDDPIYKDEFARGSTRLIPSWWDDKFKERDIKNWKHQSKCRHQWQRGKKDQLL